MLQDHQWRERHDMRPDGRDTARGDHPRHHHRGPGAEFGPHGHHGFSRERGPEFPPDGPGRHGFGRGFPHGFGRGFGRGFGHGPAVRRGDVRAAILRLLAEEPMHGYQVIQQLGERSRGMWRPSAGSVYPTLQQLEDEGLVRGEERDGRKVYSLTEAGAGAAEALGEGRPWDVAGSADAADLHELLRQVAAATSQVAEVGGPAAVGQARTILAEARRSLYRILAEDETTSEPGPATEA